MHADQSSVLVALWVRVDSLSCSLGRSAWVWGGSGTLAIVPLFIWMRSLRSVDPCATPSVERSLACSVVSPVSSQALELNSNGSSVRGSSSGCSTSVAPTTSTSTQFRSRCSCSGYLESSPPL
ncbi:hypothetical protein EDC04DRAFT_2832675 [Pisolithus marmoratus]|nr:hypothetical protein EDC04DRAFT_2832675 [Pisolithus marmoratus]